jgi:F0F1-type ATP synthase epsilon subunit
VVVLADAAEHSHEIDSERAREAEARAKARLNEQQLSEEEYARLRTALQRSLARQMVFTRKSGRAPSPVGDVTNN